MFVSYTATNLAIGRFEHWRSDMNASILCWYPSECCMMVPPAIGEWEID